MRHVKPEVFGPVCKPAMVWDEIRRYLREAGGESWIDRVEGAPDGEAVVEFGGRLCYRSWEPGLNANVTKVRTDSTLYLGNILEQGHGSVLEHANYSFVFHHVSRVFTHEFVRHRAGVAVSQESMRFVRLTDLPFWFPDWAKADEELMRRSIDLLHLMEDHQAWMAEHFRLDATKVCDRCKGLAWTPQIDGDDFRGTARQVICPTCEGRRVVSAVPFSEKKAKTSFMRRFAPDGVATELLATINVRALRHIIYMRTALGAEEEIRLVCDQVAERALGAVPNLMQDYSPNEHREWVPEFLKV